MSSFPKTGLTTELLHDENPNTSQKLHNRSPTHLHSDTWSKHHTHDVCMLCTLYHMNYYSIKARVHISIQYPCAHITYIYPLMLHMNKSNKLSIPYTFSDTGNTGEQFAVLHKPSDTRNYINYSFLPRTVVQWNKLPEAAVTSPSLDTYREDVCRLTH